MIKFLVFLIYTAGIFFLPNRADLFVLLFILHLITSAFLDFRGIWRRTWRIFPFVVLTFIFNLWLDSLFGAVWVGLKLILVTNATMIYAATVSILEFAETTEKLFSPLRLFHTDTSGIKILVCVSLAMIPIFRRELSDLKNAFRAKHMPLNLATVKALLYKFFYDLFRRTDQLESALIAKGYRA